MAVAHSSEWADRPACSCFILGSPVEASDQHRELAGEITQGWRQPWGFPALPAAGVRPGHPRGACGAVLRPGKRPAAPGLPRVCEWEFSSSLCGKQRLESLVWWPLCRLAKALAGPRNLIKKRLDKLLDFERLEEKLLEAGSVTYEEEEARHTYQALNSLLVAEIPQFNKLVGQWLGQILRTFVALQRDLAKQVLQRAEGSLAQLPHHQLSEPAFRKLVEDVLGQTGRQLRSFQENFEKVLPPPAIQPLLPGAERQVQALLSRYGPGKLYQVTGNISGAGTLDLTLPRGQVVALLHNKDTKGNSSRWLVDTGGQRGYVPAGKLELYHGTPSEEKLGEQAQPRDDSRHLTPEPTPAPVPAVPTRTQVVAMYPFVARSSHEVSLQAGQPVTVLEAQDKEGNPEWSLVEADGQQGYVPSSFLARTLSPVPWGWNLPA